MNGQRSMRRATGTEIYLSWKPQNLENDEYKRQVLSFPECIFDSVLMCSEAVPIEVYLFA